MWRRAAAILWLVQPAALWAQAADLPPEAASGEPLPAGVSIRKVGAQSVYVDAHGRTLYGMDMRAVTGRTGHQPLWCSGDCLTQWTPLAAPAKAEIVPAPPEFGGDRKAPRLKQDGPDWIVMQGPSGPQWVYKRVNLVFTHAGERPGTIGHEGEDGLVWNSLKYVPAAPKIDAPADVTARLVDRRYLLVDGQGNLLVTHKGKACGTACADWRVFPAGMARRGMGAWTVRPDGDRAQWAYRDRPVFTIEGDDPADIPAEAEPLIP